jgi:hypothetical protein
MTILHRALATAVSVLLASAVLAADVSGEPIPRPEVKAGDTWTYRQTDFQPAVPRISTYVVRVTFVGPDEILTINRNGSRDSQWNADWGAIALGGSGVIHDRPARFLNFPLKAGTSHELTFEVVARRGGTARSRFQQTVRVIGWEDVEVPAGKFRALKVEAKGTFYRLDASFGGWTRHEFWYVPETKRWVKYTYEDGTRGPSSPYAKILEELIEFKVQ